MEELLYADEESLENCKTLELVVCTVNHGVMQNNDNAVQSEVQNTESETSKLHKESKQSGNDQSNQVEGCKFTLNSANSILRERGAKAVDCGQKTLGEGPNAFQEHNSEIVTKKGKYEIECSAQDSSFIANTKGVELNHPCKEKGQSMGGEGTMADVCNIFANIILQENSLILDIDMDYFSTQNPFKLLYTEVSAGMICSKFIIVVPYTGVLVDFHVAILTRRVRYLRLKDVYINLHEAYRQKRR